MGRGNDGEVVVGMMVDGEVEGGRTRCRGGGGSRVLLALTHTVDEADVKENVLELLLPVPRPFSPIDTPCVHLFISSCPDPALTLRQPLLPLSLCVSTKFQISLPSPFSSHNPAGKQMYNPPMTKRKRRICVCVCENKLTQRSSPIYLHRTSAIRRAAWSGGSLSPTRRCGL